MDNVLSAWLAERFPEVTAREFYRYIFPAGELDTKGAKTEGKYTGIICRIATDKKHWDEKKHRYKTKVYRYTLTDELDAIDEATASNDFCICRPLSYAGRRATAEHARFLYAIAVDVDKLRFGDMGEPYGLINLWTRHIEKVKRIPKPTFIVSSGTGLHLYYVMEKPIALFKDAAFELQEYKRELTRIIWHDTIVDIKSVLEIQQEGIYQGFRMPGTVTKNGDRARAFQTGKRVTMEYLNGFVDGLYKARKAAERQGRKKSRLKLSEAAEKYPEWYERRIERKEPRGAWPVNRRLYDWWKRKIIDGATVGHRYYCCMMLAVYARKCGQYDAKHNPNPVTQEELEADCLGLLDHMEGLTNDEKNHFGLDDIQDALEAYEDKWVTYPRASIEYRTGITIPANKRNGRTQAEHIKLMNYIRDELNGNKDWHGRKSKLDIVQEWRLLHPEGTIAECIEQTGVSQATVYRHWKAAAEALETIETPEQAEERERREKLEATGREVRRLSRQLRENLAEGEAALARMADILEAMPDGKAKEEYREEYTAAAEEAEALRALINGE